MASDVVTEEPPRAGPARFRRALLWRSPPGQPPWARPLLLVIAALAGLAYGWGMAGDSVEPFYGAAARSMAGSWHDFIFGAFDPAGTVTVDKLPGALWLQALSIRVFGFHIWALVLPQVLAGVLTVLVLYRAVRRIAGPTAGLAAALVLAVTPVAVLLGRGNVSDSLLILLLVLAADATTAAILGGGLRSLLLAGLWVGLAFQAKMMQAWLVLPALAATYLLAAPAEKWRTRIAHVAAAGAITAVVSLSWMTAVSLVPAHDRPYVDGSRNDSVYEQVFDYNGLARINGKQQIFSLAGPPATFLTVQAQRQETLTEATSAVRPSWHRLLSGPFGLDGGWLLPAALISVLYVLLSRRGRGRRDPLRAAVVLWGGWLGILVVFFSVGGYLNSYYAAALAPPVAALCGLGWSLLGPWSWPRKVRLTVLATAGVTVAYGVYLLNGPSAEDVPDWIQPTVIVAFVAAAALLLLASRPRAGISLVPAFTVLAMLAVPTAAAVAVVVRGLGPFDYPFESPRISAVTQWLPRDEARFRTAIAELEARESRHGTLFGTDTSYTASTYIMFSGQEVVSIGGIWGGLPVPTMATLRSEISDGQVEQFELPIKPPSEDPRVQWIEAHCTTVSVPDPDRAIQFAYYVCDPSAVSG
ncbi:MAG TPA: glycosyltransferase family 39 protein [Streptosporangiaceae bacterium]